MTFKTADRLDIQWDHGENSYQGPTFLQSLKACQLMQFHVFLLEVVSWFNWGHRIHKATAQTGLCACKRRTDQGLYDVGVVCQRRKACFLQDAVCDTSPEKVGLIWTWGWARTSQFPWLVPCLGCQGPYRKTCLTRLITSLQSRRPWCRVLFSDALSALVGCS